MQITADTSAINAIEDLLYMMKHLVPRNKKRALFTQLGRRAIGLNRARIRRQENLDGSQFKGRADGSKKKMLTRMLRKKRVTVKSTEEGAVVTAHHPFAKAHHEGKSLTVKAMTAEQLKRRDEGFQKWRDSSDSIRRYDLGSDSPASKRQAQQLIDEIKFKSVSIDGKRRKANINNIQKAFTRGQAGHILNKERKRGGRASKTSWKVHLPVRHILGVSAEDIVALRYELRRLIVKYSYLAKAKNTSTADAQVFAAFERSFMSGTSSRMRA